MGGTQHIEQLERLIHELTLVNQRVPVLVEGKQDVQCLRNLGLSGTILKVHTGCSLWELSSQISDRYDQIILLTDWDLKGEQLHKKLKRDIATNHEFFSHFRQQFKKLCEPEILEVEQIDHYLQRLKKRLEPEIDHDP